MGKVSRALNKVENPDNTVNYAHPDKPDEIHTLVTPVNEKIPFKKAPVVSSLEEQGKWSGNWDERLTISTENYSSTAENFRKLRTLILHPDSGTPPRTILVVSAGAQEGKSFVCANLGVRLAHGSDRHALLIDCDLRRPSLHSLFGMKNSQGLVDYLTGRTNFSSLLRQTQLANLSVLPAGSPPENPSELVASDTSISLLQDAINMYDDRILIFDSPPLMAAAETLVLSQIADKVVLVVRWGRTGREEVKKVVDQIGKEKIIGIVFNAFEMNILDKKMQGVGYYNYYSQSYY